MILIFRTTGEGEEEGQKSFQELTPKVQQLKIMTALTFWTSKIVSTVELGFKNRQNKNLLDFKNQITNYQLEIYVVNYSQDKNNLDFKNRNGSDRKSS